MSELELNPESPQCLHLFCAFLAMEPTDSLISLARICGHGFISETVQRFIWEHCITKTSGKCHSPYLKNFMKKIISAVESEHGVVMDEFYEQYACYMTSLKDSNVMIEKSRVEKAISFLYPDPCFGTTSYPKSMKLTVALQSSLNMLEGDTGCSIWPSSLFMSEFILSFPELFRDKSCFEVARNALAMPEVNRKLSSVDHGVGSGVGLVGVCLAHIKASRVILTDGDLSTLANMKTNLELNQLSTTINSPEATNRGSSLIECIHVPWESYSEIELQKFTPEIILGADVIYDPLYLPDLIRVLAILLDRRNSKITSTARPEPIAYLALVIRTIETFNRFLELAGKANLVVTEMRVTRGQGIALIIVQGQRVTELDFQHSNPAFRCM